MTTDTRASGDLAVVPSAGDAGAREMALRTLDRLVGTWTVTGPDDLAGEVRYEWMDGGGWLVQHVDLRQAGGGTRGVEYIGYDETSGELRSHFFGAGGELLEYTYRLEGDVLTIWFGGTGSPARFEGRFSPDGTLNEGAWEWPGGGYASRMTRA